MVVTWRDRDSVRDLSIVTAAAFLGAGLLGVFGLPPVNVHGPQHFIGIMDPLCGMTRAVRFLALGDVDRAVEYNPASPLLVLGGIVVLGRAFVGMLTGRWLTVRVRHSPIVLAGLVLLVSALWVNQQAHAGLLMQS